MRVLIGALAAVMLAGCSTSPISAESAKPVPGNRLHGFQIPANGLAVLIVTRDEGFVGSACNTKLVINGQAAAEIGAGETAKFFLPAGENMLAADGAGVCGGGLKEREANIPAGKTKRYRISIDSSMSMDLSPTAY